MTTTGERRGRPARAGLLLLLLATACNTSSGPPRSGPSTPRATGPAAVLVVAERKAVAERKEAKMVKLSRGAIHSLGGKAAIRFVGHSHKMVHAGDRSPLLIYLEYLEDGRSVEQAQFNVYPETERTWQWRGYRFTLGDYEYGEWMELRIAPSSP